MTTTDIERIPQATLPEKVQYAQVLAKANLLPGAYRNNPGNVLLAVEYGDMLGVHPLTAVQQVHVIDGKLSMSAELMRAMVKRAGHKFRVIESTAQVATVEIVLEDDPDFPTRVSFTIEEAKTAGLTNKDNWKKYPAAMLLARATSACVRAAAPQVLLGISYVPEELGALTTEDGEPLPVVVTRVDDAIDQGNELSDQLDPQARRNRNMKRYNELVAGLTDEQRDEMKAWREAEGIELKGMNEDTAERVIAKLEEVVDPRRKVRSVDDEIVDAEIVDDEDDPGDESPGTSSAPDGPSADGDDGGATPDSPRRETQAAEDTGEGSSVASPEHGAPPDPVSNAAPAEDPPTDEAGPADAPPADSGPASSPPITPMSKAMLTKTAVIAARLWPDVTDEQRSANTCDVATSIDHLAYSSRKDIPKSTGITLIDTLEKLERGELETVRSANSGRLEVRPVSAARRGAA